jgi:hypothetical protein
MKRSRKKPFDKKFLLLYSVAVASIFVAPSASYASGDPSIVYFVGGSALVHISLFIFLAIKEKRIVQKIIKLSVYTLLSFLLWNWAMHMRDPHFLIPNSILFCGPGLLTVFLLKI